MLFAEYEISIPQEVTVIKSWMLCNGLWNREVIFYIFYMKKVIHVLLDFQILKQMKHFNLLEYLDHLLVMNNIWMLI